MAEAKLFVVTKKGRAEEFSEVALRVVIPRFRHAIVTIDEDEIGFGGSSTRQSDVSKAAQNISDYIDDAGAGPGSHLLLDRELTASQEKLRNRWQNAGREPALVHKEEHNRLLGQFGRILKELGFHWETYAVGQLSRFSGQTTPLKDWQDQFSRLKVGYLGRRLLMQLQVVAFGDNGRPFAPRRHEMIGQKTLHCYFNDGEQGGSWVSVQDELSHDISTDMVRPIEVTPGGFSLPAGDVDELVIYEDGLWSGRETVKRMVAIKNLREVRQIRLRFAVVTDFGLMVARHAIRHYQLQTSVRVDANGARFEKFVRPGLPSELELGTGMDPDAYFLALHNHVERAAFRNADDWPEGLESAEATTRAIGSQLVRRWLEKDSSPEVVAKGIKKFELGGGGFASTTVFTRSVPKVCLPLFWLSGPVSLNGNTVQWRPLFLDARRIDPALLHAT